MKPNRKTVEELIQNLWKFSARFSRSCDNPQEILNIWKAYSKYCDAALIFLGEPDCQHKDYILEYKSACSKRIIRIEEEIGCRYILDGIEL